MTSMERGAISETTVAVNKKKNRNTTLNQGDGKGERWRRGKIKKRGPNAPGKKLGELSSEKTSGKR